MSVTNPLTAMAFLTLAKEGRSKAIVQTAAASALGQMVNRLCKNEGLQMINIVRREAQKELLKEQGAEIVMNSNDANFSQQAERGASGAALRFHTSTWYPDEPFLTSLACRRRGRDSGRDVVRSGGSTAAGRTDAQARGVADHGRVRLLQCDGHAGAPHRVRRHHRSDHDADEHTRAPGARGRRA